MNPAYGGTQSALALHDRRAHSLQSKATKACLEEIWREVDMASVTSRHPAGRTGRPLTTCATRPCTLTQVLDADQVKYRRCGSQLTIEPAPRGWERAAGAVCAGPLGVSSKGHVFTQSAKGPPHIAMTALQPAAQRS